jgi:hypothetical protein
VSEHPIPLGRIRGPADGCRRYRPLRVSYDTRNVLLDLEIQEEWDSDIKALWEQNKAQVRAELLGELGPFDAQRKLDNYRAMGPAPWSVVFEHTMLLRQVRGSFAHGDFFPALVSACALGERLLHQLVLALRADYVNHRATTRQVRKPRLRNEWGALIDVLHGWSVFDDEIADTYRHLEQLRHQAVHFDADLSAAAREPALAALLALQQIVERIFEPHGKPPRYIADTLGASYLTLRAEKEPLIRRIFIPNCVLVSPAHRMEPNESSPGGWTAYDDLEYACDSLTDHEFAQRVRKIEASQTPTVPCVRCATGSPPGFAG